MPTEFITTAGATGKFTLPSAFVAEMTAGGTLDLTSAATLVYAHGGITGTLAAGDSVEVQGATGNTATVVSITDTHVLLRDVVGTIGNGVVLQEVGSAGNNVTTSSAGDDVTLVLELQNQVFDDSYSLQSITMSPTNQTIVRTVAGAESNGDINSGARIINTPGAGNPVVRSQEDAVFEDHVVICEQASGASPACLSDPDTTHNRMIYKTASSHRAVYYGSRNRFNSCIFQDSANHACEANGTFLDDTYFDGCTFEGNGGYGVKGAANSDLVMRGCVGHNNGSGLWDGVGDVDPRCENNASDGLFAEIPGGDNGSNIESISATSTDIFVDAANGDYTPAVGSPLRDAWNASPAVAFDIANLSRPQDANADIGAVEVAAGGGGGGGSIAAAAHYYYQNQG
jgi:hypothetical protein